MGRLLRFLGLVLVLTLLMYGAWILSACLLPEGLLQRFFVGRFSNVVGEFTFWKVFLANLVVGFLGVQFMNLFRVGKHAGGLYVLPVFWLIYGLLLGTNSFVFAGAPAPLSLECSGRAQALVLQRKVDIFGVFHTRFGHRKARFMRVLHAFRQQVHSKLPDFAP
jgi:MFS family permease